MDKSSIEVQVIVSGRVQGVGFRVTTKGFADELNLKGFVKNLGDGSVQISVQGNKAQLALFFQKIQYHFKKNISEFTQKELNSESLFSDFQITQ